MKNKGFTLIEILVIVAIIGTLVAIIIAMWAISAKNKAAVNSYKSSMKSVQTALELCAGTGGAILTGGRSPDQIICAGGSEVYPQLSPKCNSATPFFYASQSSPGSNDWTITTTEDSGGITGWYCQGCRMVCTVEECIYFEESEGDCYQ